jgi:hypothetical protein
MDPAIDRLRSGRALIFRADPRNSVFALGGLPLSTARLLVMTVRPGGAARWAEGVAGKIFPGSLFAGRVTRYARGAALNARND